MVLITVQVSLVLLLELVKSFCRPFFLETRKKLFPKTACSLLTTIQSSQLPSIPFYVFSQFCCNCLKSRQLNSQLLSAFQHTSVDGYTEPHVQPIKSSSRQNIPRCRNSITSTNEEHPHIGNYRLLKTIGKGNFAKVKLARHVLTGREVSLSNKTPPKPNH